MQTLKQMNNIEPNIATLADQAALKVEELKQIIRKIKYDTNDKDTKEQAIVELSDLSSTYDWLTGVYLLNRPTTHIPA